jgi:hypothetical protein
MAALLSAIYEENFLGFSWFRRNGLIGAAETEAAKADMRAWLLGAAFTNQRVVSDILTLSLSRNLDVVLNQYLKRAA